MRWAVKIGSSFLVKANLDETELFYLTSSEHKSGISLSALKLGLPISVSPFLDQDLWGIVRAISLWCLADLFHQKTQWRICSVTYICSFNSCCHIRNSPFITSAYFKALFPLEIILRKTILAQGNANILLHGSMKINVWHLSEQYFFATRPYKQELQAIWFEKPRSCCSLGEIARGKSK